MKKNTTPIWEKYITPVMEIYEQLNEEGKKIIKKSLKEMAKEADLYRINTQKTRERAKKLYQKKKNK